MKHKVKYLSFIVMIGVYLGIFYVSAYAESHPEQGSEVSANRIIYNLNGGVNNEANPEVYKLGDKVALASPVREGYAFKGWYQTDNYKGRVTKLGAKPLGDITLWAKWKPIKYKVKYVLKTGTVKKVKKNKSNPKSYTVESDTIALLPPVCKERLFAGWYLDPEFTKRVNSIEKGSTGNITLYACWDFHFKTLDELSDEERAKAQTVTTMVNEQRAAAGLPVYTENELLKKAALIRAQEIAAKFDHKRLDGTPGFSAIAEAGYEGEAVAENIGAYTSDPNEIMKAWMESKEGHREIILGDYTDVGVACFEYCGTCYWVQCFGRKG